MPRLRWWILFLIFGALTLNILDRQVLSLVAPVIRDELHISNTQYGTIVFSFLLGMTLWNIPAGLMMDRLGPRVGFTLIVAWWSMASLLHSFARSVSQFSVLRFLLGMGECGNYSGGVKIISQWFPPRERALAGGLFNSGSLVGAILAPPLIVGIIRRFGWHYAFILPSALGFLWLAPWLLSYWEPWRHPRLSEEARRQAAEVKSAAKAQPVGFLPLLGLAPVWGVLLMRAMGGPVTHFYWYWLPEYLKHGRGMSLEMIGATAWLPFFFGGLGNIGGGWAASLLMGRGWGLDKTRKAVLVASVALCLAAVLVPLAPGAASALTLISAATLGINSVAATLIGLMTDLFPEEIVARVSGITGMGDGAMSMIMMQVTGIVVDHFSYFAVFIAAGLLPLASLTAFFVFVRRVRRVELPAWS
jgi:ACS family hexuronate transporter-like MFS transporter